MNNELTLVGDSQKLDTELSLDDMTVVELEDRLEFASRCNNRCHSS
jgi:hypothetical protein